MLWDSAQGANSISRWKHDIWCSFCCVGWLRNELASRYSHPCLFSAMVAGALTPESPACSKQTGANEVIVTIMLNSIATLALGYILSKPSRQVPGSNQLKLRRLRIQPLSLAFSMRPSRLHGCFRRAPCGDHFLRPVRSTWALKLELLVLIPRPPPEFRWGRRNHHGHLGCLSALCGRNEALGTVGCVSRDITGTIGFDATWLFGSEQAPGHGAGVLFEVSKVVRGANSPGEGRPDRYMILILQSVIVLLVAAPMFVRWLFHPLQGNQEESFCAELAELSDEHT